MRIINYLAACGLGVICGWYFRRRWEALPVAARRPEPLEHDEYIRRLDRLDRAYTESIKEYDRLVTWASGGALFLSITFVEKLAPKPSPASAWLLRYGWGLLAAALLLSLMSQYFSSRTHSWRMKELNHLQEPVSARTAVWATVATRYDRVSRAYGKVTKWATALSGVALVAGLVYLAGFAFANLSFVRP